MAVSRRGVAPVFDRTPTNGALTNLWVIGAPRNGAAPQNRHDMRDSEQNCAISATSQTCLMPVAAEVVALRHATLERAAQQDPAAGPQLDTETRAKLLVTVHRVSPTAIASSVLLPGLTACTVLERSQPRGVADRGAPSCCC
jgi:hypothetical protein